MTEKKPEKIIKPTYGSVWETLSKVDCSDHIDKKNGFNYLSWAWAMGIMMEHYPQHKIINRKNDNMYPCFYDPIGRGMVNVRVVIDDLDRDEDYPVLDYRNKAVDNPDPFQINTALKRGYVKTLAQFGLGHYIYAGEDLPELDRASMIKKIESQDEKWLKIVCDHYTTNTVSSLSDEELGIVYKRIKEKE